MSTPTRAPYLQLGLTVEARTELWAAIDRAEAAGIRPWDLLAEIVDVLPALLARELDRLIAGEAEHRAELARTWAMYGEPEPEPGFLRADAEPPTQLALETLEPGA